MSGKYLSFLVLIALGMFFSGGCLGPRMPKFPHRFFWRAVYTADSKQKLSQKFEFLFFEKDGALLKKFVRALTVSYQRVSVWGELRHPIKIYIFPNHYSLQRAVNRNFDWLRAWALYSEIYIQSPFTWEIGPYYYALVELLTHELTHTAMYQLCCSSRNWYRKYIPLWFREGMASFTARQGYRRLTPRELGKFLKTGLGRKLWAHPERYLERFQGQIYSLAHWEFTFLVRNYGIKSAKGVLRGMRDGLSFEGAFSKNVGLSVGEFRKKVRNWILSYGKSRRGYAWRL